MKQGLLPALGELVYLVAVQVSTVTIVKKHAHC